MNTSEHIDAIATALVAVQAKLENVTPGASGQFGSYLTLGDVLNAVRPVLTEHGIAVIQSPGLDVDSEGGKGGRPGNADDAAGAHVRTVDTGHGGARANRCRVDHRETGEHAVSGAACRQRHHLSAPATRWPRWLA